LGVANYKYLIIGGGMTADAAVQGIRQVDPDGTIGLVGEETHTPYNRPPLSKGLWKARPLETIWRRAAVEEAIFHPGRKAVKLEPAEHRVTDDRGTVYTYQKLLLATGGRPRRLPLAANGIIYFRTLDDYHRLRALTEQGQRFAVIGGGFIGSEIAAALAENGKSAVMVFPEEAICGRLFPAALASHLNDLYRQRGVEVLPGDAVGSIERLNGCTALRTVFGRELIVDGIVAGIGIEPNVELAQAARLTVEDGIRVDASLRTSHPDIFAAGDVASFYSPVSGRFQRVEHEDNANTMGLLAGRAMAGEPVAYHHLPFFYSDLFEWGYEAVGELDPQWETVLDWKEPFREGVVYYLRDGEVRGVLLWNVRRQIDAARQLVASSHRFRPDELRGRIG